MKKFARFLAIIYNLVFYLYAVPSTLYPAYAQNPGPAGILQIQEMILRFINISVGLAFFAVTATLVWAGIKFISSGGESKALSEAWLTVTWALMGVVFLVLSWLILRLIESFTGVPVSSAFCIGFPGAPTSTLKPGMLPGQLNNGLCF